MNDIMLLDCTLRDGGYINDWQWGFEDAKKIINLLLRARVDVIEVGFLRNINFYEKNRTVCNHIEELNSLLPENSENSMFSAMAMRSNYDIGKLSHYSGEGIELIRITAHEDDINEGLDFALEVQNLGYKVSVNPINIMGYSDRDLMSILEKVEEIHPWQFSIVDTFGSMKRRDLDRIVSIVDNNLAKDIRLAIHLHENMSQSFSLAQAFTDKHLNRPVAIDGSLMGMGRTPGNLPIELIADYLNEYMNTGYDIDFMLDAIQDYIMPIKGNSKWGYNPSYFLSAKYNLHRNYAEYYINKGDLLAREINHLLSRFDSSKGAIFDKEYADQIYAEYMDAEIDDTADRRKLKMDLAGKHIVILAPGKSVLIKEKEIKEYIESSHAVVIAINFNILRYHIDYIFFGNNRRYSQAVKIKCKKIATSNVKGDFDYYINHNDVSRAYKQGNNALVMLLMLLKQIGYERVAVAGADGYDDTIEDNYYIKSIRASTMHSRDHNNEVATAIKNTGVMIEYLTESRYEID